MANIRKKPNYDPEKVRNEMIELVRELYENESETAANSKNRTLSSVAGELDISVSKVVKLLITGGAYMPDMARQVNELYESGFTVAEIQSKLNVSRATVQSYLPYRKGIYSAKDTSVNADRIQVYRKRNLCVESLQDSLSEKDLWETVVLFQNYPFYTASGLPFSYVLKKGRDGTFNKELVVNRRQESKTLAWSSVILAFNKALEKQGEVVERPKALGDIRGISYIYPILYRFGIIQVPLKTAEKMQVRGGVKHKTKTEKGL